MVGETISHFKIIDKLGQGGMGEVYLAQDVSLDRQITLKFLPNSLQDDSNARQRLLREAKSAAALNHPLQGHSFAGVFAEVFWYGGAWGPEISLAA